jgi:four helix bundle protein
MDIDLNNRLFDFAVNVLKLLRNLKGGREYEVIRYQLSKSATSSGANYEESQAASSRADFGNKICIVLKELRETNYWLRILKELYPDNDQIIALKNESEELKRIVGRINSKVNKT